MRTVNFENGSPPSFPPSKQVIQGKQTRDREYDCACERGRIDGGYWQNLHSRPNWQLSARWNWNWVVEVVGTLFFFCFFLQRNPDANIGIIYMSAWYPSLPHIFKDLIAYFPRNSSRKTGEEKGERHRGGGAVWEKKGRDRCRIELGANSAP